ncbi:Ger(x)C family spore germination protein [Bacillus sp. FJAT-45037]|uniref:Ger(x)C family spore germination protein n=1 Tax=Bacillus sp. FJAT-45037 TaxID=2011007 RepID=UPI000C23D4DA|nr:Ger(x)C family spore germination protein [Bacillus sp. FJAT-45037]
MVNKIIIIALSITLILTGCADIQLVEEIGFINIAGYDLYEEGESNKTNPRTYQITFGIPLIDPDKTKPREILQTVGHTSKEGRMNLARKTDRSLVSGQLRTTLFGIDLAEKGILDISDTMLRDPTIGSRVKLAIVNGRANELLAKEYPEHPKVGPYVDMLLEQGAKSSVIPDTDLYQFTTDLLERGIDPIIPVIKTGEKEVIIDGIGLLKGDKYITKINPQDTFSFLVLYQNFNTGELKLSLPNEEDKQEDLVIYSSFRSKRKINVVSTTEPFEVTIDVSLKGNIVEYHGSLDLETEEDQEKLKVNSERFIEAKTAEIIKTLQKNNVDSIGLGKNIRNSISYEDWENLDWEGIYPDVTVNINANVNIRDFGLIQ